MTHEEFRADRELVKWMRELAETENFRLVLEAMKSIDPVKQVAPKDVTPHGAHILLGEQTGWAQYENEFLKLATRLPIPKELPEPDYSGDEPRREDEA